MRRSQNVSAPVAAIVIVAALAVFFLVFSQRPSQEVATPTRPVPEAPPAEETQIADLFKGLSPLGVMAVVPPLLEDRGKGARLAAVVKDSPAARGGLQPGDLVTTLGDERLMSAEILVLVLTQVKPEQTYQMEVVRSGKTLKLPITGITPLPPEERVKYERTGATGEMEGRAMSAGGQKQEVRVLAMAIGALVVSVALFVGMRALSNRPATASSSNPPAKQRQAKVVKQPQKKTEKVAPLPSSDRDPFASVGAADVPTAAPRRVTGGASARRALREADAGPDRGQGSELDTAGLRLSGILRGSAGATAVVHIGDARYYANLGDQVAGYTLVKVGTNSVVLAQGGRYLTLSIQPEPGGGGVRTRARTTNRRR